MNPTLELIEDYLRLISYACAPLLTIAALYGLKQIKNAKESAKTQAKRDSYRLAADQCTLYVKEIIPAQDSLDKKSVDLRKVLDRIVTVEVTASSYSVTFNGKVDLDGFKSIHEEFVRAFNLMEVFANPFISGLAQESVAYSSVGTTYCSHVRTYLPYLSLLNAGKIYYKNLMKLYLMWNSRIEVENLQEKKAEIDKSLGRSTPKKIQVIGDE